jgi:hypothetical protein
VEQMKKVIDGLFLNHPQSVNETYFQHMRQALYFAFHMCVGFFVCLCHAFIPGAFEKTGSQLVTKLHDRMVENRLRQQTTQNHIGENTKTNHA